MKLEFDEAEDFMNFAKLAGVSHIGVQIAVKNENAGPVVAPQGIVQGVRTTALLVLTAVARTKNATEDGLLCQRQVLSEMMLSEEDAKAINDRIAKEKAEAFKVLQAKCPKAEIIEGRILL